MKKQESPYRVASVDRAMELLLILGKSPRDMGVTELSKLLGVQKSTVHSLLQTMLGRGFVRQTNTGRYTLGFGLIQLGAASAEKLDIRTIAHPFMVELAAETQEITLLAVLSGTELTIIDKIEPQRQFLLIPKFDFSIALHSTASGKVLLANAPEAVIDEVLQRNNARFTPYTLTDRAALAQELAKVRQAGYAVGCNETIEGVTCLAVPVFGAGGKVIAALSVSGASSGLTIKRYDEVIGSLKNKAKIISEHLGYKSVLCNGGYQ